jgi:uncharacterized membrane protein YkoI
MRKASAAGAVVLVGLLAAALAVAAPQQLRGERYAKQAKISLAQARASALKARPGEITDQELEREKGGSGLRYSFDIKATDATYEVGVDARTGAVLENSKEGAHPD